MRPGVLRWGGPISRGQRKTCAPSIGNCDRHKRLPVVGAREASFKRASVHTEGRCMQLFPFSHTQRLSRTPPHSPALSLRKALSRQTPSALRPPETMPPKRKARTEAGPSQTPVRLLAAPARHSARPPRRPCTHATRAHQQRHHTANPARPHCASRAAPARCAHSLVLPTSAQKSPLLSELTMDAFEEVWTKFAKKAIDEARDRKSVV